MRLSHVDMPFPGTGVTPVPVNDDREEPRRMTEPTPPESDAEQFTRRYADTKDAVDGVRDALLNAGPSVDEHRAALSRIDEENPGFALAALLTFASYVNNQPGELDKETLGEVVSLWRDYGAPVIESANNVNASVLAVALGRLGIALRNAKLVEWTDGTPDDAAATGSAPQ